MGKRLSPKGAEKEFLTEDEAEDESQDDSLVSEDLSSAGYPSLDEFREPSPGVRTRSQSRHKPRLDSDDDAARPSYKRPARHDYERRPLHGTQGTQTRFARLGSHSRCYQIPAWAEEEFLGFPLWQLVLVAGVLLLLLLIPWPAVRLFFFPRPVLMKSPNAMEDFRKELSSLRAAFPGVRSWAPVTAAVRDVLETQDPRAPAVLLIAGPDEAANRCLARGIAEAALVAYRQTPRSYWSLTAPLGRLELDSGLRSGLATANVAVVEGIEKLRGAAPLSLHAFADADDASVKDAVLILTLALSSLREMAEGDCDAAIHSALEDAWTDVAQDQMEPLVSRISKNVLCLASLKGITC